MLLLLLVSLGACKKVPEAPSDFTDLCAYIYGHTWDDDPAALIDGLDALHTYLSHDWDPSQDTDGFTVASLSQEDFDAVDDQERTTQGMIGLALPTECAHSIIESTYALVAVDQDEIFDDFTYYERTYSSGPDCFIERSCERMEAAEHMKSDFSWGFTSESYSFNQYAWADMQAGTAMVQRNWLQSPPEVSSLMPEVDQQAYINIFIPKEQGAYRVQAQWTVYDGDLSEAKQSAAKTLIINFFQNTHDQLEAWLDEHDVP